MAKTLIICTKGGKPITPHDRAKVDLFIAHIKAKRKKHLTNENKGH